MSRYKHGSALGAQALLLLEVQGRENSLSRLGRFCITEPPGTPQSTEQGGSGKSAQEQRQNWTMGMKGEVQQGCAASVHTGLLLQGVGKRAERKTMAGVVRGISSRPWR